MGSGKGSYWFFFPTSSPDCPGVKCSLAVEILATPIMLLHSVLNTRTVTRQNIWRKYAELRQNLSVS